MFNLGLKCDKDLAALVRSAVVEAGAEGTPSMTKRVDGDVLLFASCSSRKAQRIENQSRSS